jgi:hypothetical protein
MCSGYQIFVDLRLTITQIKFQIYGMAFLEKSKVSIFRNGIASVPNMNVRPFTTEVKYIVVRYLLHICEYSLNGMCSVYNIRRTQWVVISLADHKALLESMIAITEQSENG